MAKLLSFSRVRKLPYRLSLRNFAPPPLIWSKGFGDYCDFSGTRDYRLAGTESTESTEFFAEHYGRAHGLVWLRLGTISRDGRRCDLDTFVQAALPLIDRPFVLVTTDGDASVPSDLPRSTVAALKAHPKVVGWYSQNCDGSDPFVRPFPIGLDWHTLRNWTTASGLARNFQRLAASSMRAASRPLRIFCDLKPHANEARRQAVESLRDCPDVDFVPAKRVSQTEIWKRYARYPFVLSAHGNGLDCHRTWEALGLGCIVITRTSSLDPLYEGLPVVILEDWREARDPRMLARWIEALAPLTDAAHISERLDPRSWLRPLRERLAAASASSAFPDAPASSDR